MWTSVLLGPALSPSVTSRKLLLMQMPRVGSQGRMEPRCSTRQAAHPIFSLGYPNTATSLHLLVEQASVTLNYPWSKGD